MGFTAVPNHFLLGGRKMRRLNWIAASAIGALVMLIPTSLVCGQNDQKELLNVREAVWRAWFAGDTKTLEQLVPADTIVISSGEEKWHNQAEVLQSAAQFRADGGKLLRLEFPRTEIQRFGDVAILYSLYEYETETGGKRSVTSGRGTEVFVLRNGKWTNPGWHMDSGK
jgi:hypothetical protein